MNKNISKVVAATLVISNIPAVSFADASIEKLVGKDRFETAIKVSKSGWKTANTVVLVNEKAIADALAITPLAEEKNAPILLTGKDSLNKLTKEEIKRLGAKNIILAGGTSMLSEKLERELKELKLNIDRISGKNREETSLEILKRLDKIDDISEVVVVNGATGLADAVSIASIAAKNNMGIILANPKNGIKVFEEFIKNEDIIKSYVIGGDKAIPNKLIESLPSKERLSGANRTETNVRILEKFYSSKKLNAMYVAKDGMAKENQLVDALSVGVLAAKNDSPMIIVSNGLKDYQKKYINSKKIEKVIQVGGNGNENAFNQIINLQKTKVYKVKSSKELKDALEKADANDKIVIDFNTKEDIIINTDASVDIENNGNLGNIIVNGSNTTITNKGEIDKVEINGSNNVEVNNESSGSIGKIEIDQGSNNIVIENNGKIENIENNGSGTEIKNEGKVENIENNGSDAKVENNGSIDKVTGDEKPNIDGNKPGGGTTSGGSTGSGGTTGGGETEKPEVEKSYVLSKEAFQKLINSNDIKITFEKGSLENLPEDKIDISEDGKGEIFAYKEKNILHVVSDKKIFAPKDMSNIFMNFAGTEIDLSNFDTSKVTDMSGMFSGCSTLIEITFGENFNTTNVTDMSNMFNGCANLSGSITIMSTKLTNYEYMFNDACTGDAKFVVKYANNEDVKKIAKDIVDVANNTNVSLYDAANYELSKSKLRKVILDNSNFTKIEFVNKSEMTPSVSVIIDVSEIGKGEVFAYRGTGEDENILYIASDDKIFAPADMSFMFDGCSNLTSIDLSNLDTSQVYNMNGIFYNCSSLGSIDLSKFDTSKVTDMRNIFYGCSSLGIIDLSNFNTSQVTDMLQMFQGCEDLKEIIFGENFSTENVTDMRVMFSNCSSLESIDLSKFDTSKVTNMVTMFSSCPNLSGNITIMNPNTNYYAEMFNGTATAEGTQFTVNYTAGCEEMVNKILDKSISKGNVIKGNEVTFPPTTE